MPEESDPLQSLIADIIEAESRGDAVDRAAVLRQHPEHADSLREFFANHDSMKAGSYTEDVTSPPSSPSLAEDVTLPPSKVASEEEATLAARTSTTGNAARVGDKVRYFGDYELLEEIARGGMGVVYKARQINLNRIVALKMILAGQLAGEEDVKRFYTEAEAAANLDHPGVVPIFEVGQHQGQHFFSMGYIEGQSLAQKVAGNPLPPREAAEMVKKICAAISYAHERGVIHRDLKPANILLDQNGQPKVTDFGLAKQMNVDSGLTGTGQILGTPSYMAPEQASGKVDEVGPAADIYALGAILYCLLAGRPPFQAANPMDTLLQVLDKEPISPKQLNESVPKDLETLCLKCLEKDASRRYRTANELGEELQRYLSGTPLLARPVSIVERGWRWCKRNPALSATAAGLFAVLLAISIIAPIVAITQSTLKREAIALNQTAIDKAEEATRAKQTAEMRREEAESAGYEAASLAISSNESLADLNLTRARALRGMQVANRKKQALDAITASMNLQRDAERLTNQLTIDPHGLAASSKQFWKTRIPELRREATNWLQEHSLQQFYLSKHAIPPSTNGSTRGAPPTRNCLAVSDDGGLLAVVHESQILKQNQYERQVDVINVETGEMLSSFKIDSTHSEPSIGICFNSTHQLHIIHATGAAYVSESRGLPSGNLLKSTPLMYPDGRAIGRISRLEFSPDRSMILAIPEEGTSQASVWTMHGTYGASLPPMRGLASGLEPFDDGFFAQCFSSTGAEVIGLRGSSIEYWSIESQEIVRSIPIPTGRVSAIHVRARNNFQKTTPDLNLPALYTSDTGEKLVVLLQGNSTGSTDAVVLDATDGSVQMELQHQNIFSSNRSARGIRAMFLASGDALFLAADGHSPVTVSVPGGNLIGRLDLPPVGLGSQTTVPNGQVTCLTAAKSFGQIFARISPDPYASNYRGAGQESPLQVHVVAGWDISIGEFPPRSIVIDSAIKALEFADEQLIFTGNADSTLQVLNRRTATRKIIGIPLGTEHYRDRGFSPDGEAIVTWEADGRVNVWDAVTGTLRKTVAPNEFLGISVDRGMIAFHDTGQSNLRLYDADTNIERVLPNQFANFKAAIFSPGNKYLFGLRDDECVVLDALTGNAVHTSEFLPYFILDPLNSQLNEMVVRFESQNKFVLVSGRDPSSGNSSMRRIALPAGAVSEVASAVQRVGTWDVASRVIALDGSAVFFLGPKKGTQDFGQEQDYEMFLWFTGEAEPKSLGDVCRRVTNCFFSSDSKRMLVQGYRHGLGSSNEFIEIWDLQSLLRVENPAWKSDAVLKYFDNYDIAIGREDSTGSLLFDLHSDALTKMPFRATSLSSISSSFVSKDRLVQVRSIGDTSDSLEFFDAATRRVLSIPDLRASEALRVVVDGGPGKTPVIVAALGNVSFIDPESGKKRGECLSSVPLTERSNGITPQLNLNSISPQGKVVALQNMVKAELIFWDMERNVEISRASMSTAESSEQESPRFEWCGYSNTGDKFACEVDGQMRVYDVGEGQQLAVLGRLGHTSSINDIAFSKVTAEVFSASDDGTICAWDAITGEFHSSTRDQSGIPLSLALSATDSRLAGINSQGMMHIWELPTTQSDNDKRLFPPLRMAGKFDGFKNVIGKSNHAKLRFFTDESGVAALADGTLVRIRGIEDPVGATTSTIGPPFSAGQGNASISADVIARLESTGGAVANGFTFCLELPLSEIEDVSQQLAKSGFRPLRCRPYQGEELLQCAAIWIRDGKKGHLVVGAGLEKLDQLKSQLAGFRPIDIAGYLAIEKGEAQTKFAVAWEATSPGDDQTHWQVLQGDLTSTFEPPVRTAFRSVQQFHAADGSAWTASILEDGDSGTFTRIRTSAGIQSAMREFQQFRRKPLDICDLPHQSQQRDALHRKLEQLRALPASQKTGLNLQADVSNRKFREAQMLSELGQIQQALGLLTEVIEVNWNESYMQNCDRNLDGVLSEEELRYFMLEPTIEFDQKLALQTLVFGQYLSLIERAILRAESGQLSAAVEDLDKAQSVPYKGPFEPPVLRLSRLMLLIGRGREAIELCNEQAVKLGINFERGTIAPEKLGECLELARIYALGVLFASGEDAQIAKHNALLILKAAGQVRQVDDYMVSVLVGQLASSDFDSVLDSLEYSTLYKSHRIGAAWGVIFSGESTDEQVEAVTANDIEEHRQLALKQIAQGFRPIALTAGRHAESADVAIGSLWTRSIQSPIAAFDIAASGKTIAAVDESGQVRIVDAKSGAEARALTPLAINAKDVAFSPQEDLLVVVGNDVKLWHLESGELLFSTQHHERPINAVQFSPSGDVFATASDDQTVAIWPVKELSAAMEKLRLGW